MNFNIPYIKNDKLTSWDLIFAIMLKVAHSSLLWLQKIEYLSLITMKIAKSLLTRLKKSAKYRPFDLDAWCILPDHIHFNYNFQKMSLTIQISFGRSRRTLQKIFVYILMIHKLLSGKIVFGSIRFETNAIYKPIISTQLIMPSNMALSMMLEIGNGQASVRMILHDQTKTS